jgi:two-component system, chemotaxis family, sensor kinase CheA
MGTDYKNINQDVILHTFLAESMEQLREMEGDLVRLETQPADQEILNNIFRIVHTVKGSSSCIELPSVTQYAHSFENVLAGLRDQSVPVTRDSITLLLLAVDCLRQVVSSAVIGEGEILPEHEALLVRISEIKHRNATEAVRERLVPSEPSATTKGIKPDRRQADQHTTLRIDTRKLDRMLNLSTEILIARGRLKQALQARGFETKEDVSQPLQVIDRLFLELQELIMKSRMVSLGTILRQYVRTVRDLAQATGKSARLVLEGDEAEVDTSVVEYLRDPLTHIIRNAIDHGIEHPIARTEKGKDPCGSIKVTASQHGGSIIIQVSDDGAGLNEKRIMEQAVLRGIISDTARLTEEEIHRLILQPGFSTADKVTEISGRGVGMDVVRRNIEAINGSIEVGSRPSAGTTITIRLPLTLAIIDGFIVGVGNETYVIPMSCITGCLELSDPAKQDPEPGGLINLRGEAVPYVRLRKLFDVTGLPPARESLVLVKHDAGHAGFAVDNLYGQGQVVIKPLGKLFSRLPGVSGSTVLGDGRVALVLDIPALIRESAGQYS